MRQQFLTKFVALWHILKHFVVDDVSRVILKSYIDLLLEGDNRRTICIWFAEIKWFGLDSPYKFSYDVQIKIIKGISHLINPNIELSIRQNDDICDILNFEEKIFLKFYIELRINKTDKWIFILYAIDRYRTLSFISNSDMYDANKLKEVVNYLKIKN